MQTPGTTSSAPVLIAYDGSAGATRALAAAADLAEGLGVGLRILFAQGPIPGEQDANPSLREAVDKLLRAAVDEVAETHPSLPVETHVEWSAPRKVLIEASREARVTVVGRRGHGPLKSVVLGSVSGALAAHAHGPVLVVPDAGPTGSDKVVVGIDGSPDSLRAAEVATAMAAGRPVVLLMAWEPINTTAGALGPYGGMVLADPAADEAAFREVLDSAVDQVVEAHPETDVRGKLVHGNAALALGSASEDAALVVVATRGHGGFTGLLLGSVAQSVIQTSACPVLVTRT